MNFERGVDPKRALGIGELGRRGLSYEYPYIKSSALQIHVKYLAWALDGWYKKQGKNISIFHFPCTETNEFESELIPPFVITAAPGEPTDYDSIYRKIEYSEIVSRFFQQVRESFEFRSWLLEFRSGKIFWFLKVGIDD